MIEGDVDRSVETGRRKGRKHYPNRCSVCCREMGYGRWSLHIHHVDWNRQNNSLDNLIPVCNDCHRAVHNSGLHNPHSNSDGAIFNELVNKNRGEAVQKWQETHYRGVVDVHILPETIAEIDAQTDNRSEFIREAVEEQL